MKKIILIGFSLVLFLGCPTPQDPRPEEAGATSPGTGSETTTSPLRPTEPPVNPQLPSRDQLSQGLLRSGGLVGSGVKATGTRVSRIPFNGGELEIQDADGTPLKPEKTGDVVFTLKTGAYKSPLKVVRFLGNAEKALAWLPTAGTDSGSYVDFRISKHETTSQTGVFLEVFLSDPQGRALAVNTFHNIETTSVAFGNTRFFYSEDRLDGIRTFDCRGQQNGEIVFEYGDDGITGKYYYDYSGYTQGSRDKEDFYSVYHYDKDFHLRSYDSYLYDNTNKVSKMDQKILYEGTGFTRYTVAVKGFHTYSYLGESVYRRYDGSIALENPPVPPKWIIETAYKNEDDWDFYGARAVQIRSEADWPLYQKTYDNEGNLRTTWEYVFNDKNQVVEQIEHDSQNRQKSKDGFTYDDEGRRLLILYYDATNTLYSVVNEQENRNVTEEYKRNHPGA